MYLGLCWLELHCKQSIKNGSREKSWSKGNEMQVSLFLGEEFLSEWSLPGLSECVHVRIEVQ